MNPIAFVPIRPTSATPRKVPFRLLDLQLNKASSGTLSISSESPSAATNTSKPMLFCRSYQPSFLYYPTQFSGRWCRCSDTELYWDFLVMYLAIWHLSWRPSFYTGFP